LTLLDVGGAELEHAVEQSGELVSPGVNGDGCAQAAFDTPNEGADRRLALMALWAASRNIAVARFLVFPALELSTLPPLIRLSGHNFNQEQKCFSLFQQFMSKPVSAMIVCTATFISVKAFCMRRTWLLQSLTKESRKREERCAKRRSRPLIGTSRLI
jgi:hypothetical protein